MPKKNEYNVESMESAINEVKNNNMSYRNAAYKYGVPKSTLEFKVKNPGHKDTCGPSPILSLREESDLVRWIEGLASNGFPRKKDDILNSVQKFLTDNPRPNPFKNNRPGDSWLKAFLKRHPTIVQRTSESVSAASGCVSESDIRKWFKDINNYLVSKNIKIDDPSRIYNGDESGFQICPATGKVFAGKGAKNVYSVEKGSPKENITVMFSFSASGITCPPMIIYPYKRIPEKISVTVNPDWGIGRSDTGWMTSETFFDYVKNIFYPFVVKNNIQFPVILFLDGHKSHLTYELSLLCNELNIEVIALYPNATRILQPCDVAVFRPIKIGWKTAVREFYEQNPGQVLNKITFAPLLEKVVNNNVKAETLINGFRVCGLFPFDPDAVDYTKCLGKENTPTEVKMPNRMDHNTFVGLAGEDLIKRFKLFDDMLIREGITDEFLTLYKIWNYFEKPDSLSNEKKDNVDIPEKPVLPVSVDNQLLNSASAAETNPSEHPPQNESKLKIIQNIVLNQPNTNTSFSLPSTSNNISVYLKEPEKPSRKNKRDIEKVSFAVTSRDYQKSFERKRALKLEKENEKLERKRKREENAKAKALKKTRAADNNNLCFVCKVRTIKTNYLSCDSCKKRIHRRCVPKKFEANVPEEGEDDLFICHICYSEESEDVDSEIESDEESEIYDRRELENSEIESDEESEIYDRREIDSKIGREAKDSVKKINNMTVSENQNAKEIIKTQCDKASEMVEGNPIKTKKQVGRMLQKKQKVLTEIVEECKISDQMEIKKVDEEKERMIQNPQIIKNNVGDDEIEIDELFDMYQKEMKNRR